MRRFLWWGGLGLLFWGGWVCLSWSHPTYASERSLWPAEVAARGLLQDPASSPPVLFKETLNRLQRVIQHYPTSASAARAQLLIGQIHHARGDFKKARQELAKVIELYPTMPHHVIDAYKTIALTYDEEGNWNRVLGTYRTLLAAYPLDVRVLSVPIRMVELSRRYAPESAEAVFEEAVEAYRRVLKEGKPGRLHLMTRQMLATCLLRSGRWEEAAGEFETLAKNYPTRREVPIWIKTAEKIRREKLR